MYQKNEINLYKKLPSVVTPKGTDSRWPNQSILKIRNTNGQQHMKKSGRDRERHHLLSASFPKYHSSQESILVSMGAAGGQVSGHPSLLPRYISRELGWKERSQDSEWQCGI